MLAVVVTVMVYGVVCFTGYFCQLLQFDSANCNPAPLKLLLFISFQHYCIDMFSVYSREWGAWRFRLWST